ncbi:MAG: glycosyltransferase family 39 protein [Burkholderiales bacterium]|nr:glycosyltransferase family 39 protein [Burkholderiales bacterium]
MLPDEGRYVGVAMEMLRSGDWATPTLNGLPFFHKPPLFYWITSAALSLFGPHALAARAASLLGATAAALSLLALSRRWPDAHGAPPLLPLLLTMPIFFIGAQFANMDMLVAGCISVAITAFAHAVLLGAPRPRAVLATAYAALALGVLAKGLIGVVLPALVLAVWLLATRRIAAIARLLWWPGIVLFVVVALPWFALMQARHPGFFDYFIVEQHVRRFAQGGFNNAQPGWFYAVALLGLGAPWTLMRLPALWQSTRDEPPPASPLRALMLAWFGVVLLFFSLPQSKLVGYVLPAVPPMAWLLAGLGPRPSARGLRVGVALGCLIGAAAVGALAWTGRGSAEPIARVLRAEAAGERPRIFVGSYLYGLPGDAGAVVVDDWDSPEVRQRDNWRKELADAGRFAPERARQRLLPRERLPALLCAQPASWLIAPLDERGRLPLPPDLTPRAQAMGAGLWPFDRAAAIKAGVLRCPGTPNAG